MLRGRPLKRRPVRGIRRLGPAPRRFRGRLARGYTRRTGYYNRFPQGDGELKFHDVDIDDAVIASGGTIALDSAVKIAQGTSESERIGRKMTVRRIGWKFDIDLPTTATAASTSDYVRIILYWDKQTNGATATVATILQGSDYQSFRNLSDITRYKILMDRSYSIQSTAGSGRGSTDTLSYGEAKIVDSFYKRCSIPIEYNNTMGAITEIRTNNIGVLTISKSGLAGFTSKMRISFSDQ